MKITGITDRYVRKVYDELEHYIIIGLTGRCGSGCSTTRDILSGERGFNPEDYMGSDKLEPDQNSDRDRSVILNFAEHNPIHFETIRVRDILTSFILENRDAFFEVLNQVFYELCGNGTKIKEDFYHYFDSEISMFFGKKIIFDEVSKMSGDIWSKINDNVYSFIENITREQYDFLFSKEGEISRVIRDFLIHYGDEDKYTIVYQHVGNLVRTYGRLVMPDEYSDCANINEDGMYAIAKRINSLLKIMRRKEWILDNCDFPHDNRKKPISKSKVHVVIDSIKNVFEAEYLKVRYHSFYLVALTLDDERRRQRLKLKKGLNDLQMDIIDVREQPSRAKELIKKYRELENEEKIEKAKEDNLRDTTRQEKQKSVQIRVYEKLFDERSKCSKLFKMAYENDSYIFKMQDVDGCVQNADILINNGGTKEELGLKIIRYVCLMLHPGLVPPTDDERCMQVAQSAKLNSGCISRQVGAVVSDSKGNILSVGWNDAAATDGNECIGCIRRSFDKLICQKDEMAYSYYELTQTEFREKLKDIMKKVCSLNKEELSDEELYTRFMKEVEPKIQGLPLAFCFKDIYSAMMHDRNQVHTRAQHGEENALEACDKNKCSGGTLYTTSSSCELCAKKALHYNIRRMVYIEPYSGITNEHVLGHMVQNGVKVRRDKVIRNESMKVELFTGATQSAYARLYTPIFPLKDELKLRGVNLQ